jgi:hypothetical protein
MELNPVSMPGQSQTQMPSTPITVDENTGELEISDPKLMNQKLLLDAMFGKDKENDLKGIRLPFQKGSNEKEQAPQPMQDTVTISEAAMVLSRKQSADITFQDQNGRVEIKFTHEEHLEIDAKQQVKSSDPLIIDLGKNGLDISDARDGNTVLFDINADGSGERVSWVGADDGFLAFDRNGNGVIDDAKELFGDQNGAKDGFSQLAQFDGDYNGIIDGKDQIFKTMSIWQDKNQNGITDPGELNPVSSYGITAINLNLITANDLVSGNRITGYSTYESTSKKGIIAEAFLNYMA